MKPIRHLIVGAPEHGVTRHALAVTELLPHEIIRAGHPPPAAELPTDGLLHLHLTDRLYGPNPEAAAQVVSELAAGRACSVTLHDLPQPSDGPVNHPRRARSYACIANACAGVIVASQHEAGLLRAACERAGAATPDIEVIPLPIDALPFGDVGDVHHVTNVAAVTDVDYVAAVEGVTDVACAASRAASARPRHIGVLGFLYPGKGHEAALDACAGCPPDVGLLALGGPSPGHEDLVELLVGRAASMGRRAVVTGYLPDEQLTTRLRQVAVPAAPHEHVSASGSIGSWIAAGRRPLVPSSAYVRELAARDPQAVIQYGPQAPAGAPPTLPDAIRDALADARLTWREPNSAVGPSSAQVAAAYGHTLHRWAR